MISIKCPHCQVGLKVDEQKVPKKIKSFKCPKCKGDIPTETLGGSFKKSQASQGDTILIRPVLSTAGKLTVFSNDSTKGQIFSLEEGKYILGRKASVSNANLCIETDDRLMSRHHLSIEVKKDSKGSLICMISDNQSKNRSKYNGRFLDSGEIVVLQDNDEIVIGQTTLRFNE